MKTNYKEIQRSKAVKLIQDRSQCFYGAKGGKYFMRSQRDFVLTEWSKNIYQFIQKDVTEYFSKNKISWWGGLKPTGHVLSSQIACLNHLFLVRNDKSAVMDILKNISSDFVDVIKIESDEYFDGYIQFESVSINADLGEGNPTRGNNCTSIDALILAKHRDCSVWLIPIEWKYTEHYNNQDKSKEGKDNAKGIKRLLRYSELIMNSTQLKSTANSCFYFEPFYQLMRQTLWAERMIANKITEKVKADNYLHVHVIPKDNAGLLDKKYKCCGLDMETTWRSHLINQSKYLIITPEKLLSGINGDKYKDLIDYLTVRYWNK
jgi:hypothetical protein